MFMHGCLPWYFRRFIFSNVQVKPKSYLSRPGLKNTHFSLLMSSGVNACGRTDSAQCSEGTWGINYVCGNLFSCPKDESLAHCISEDCRMGAGIAVMFKKEFDGVDDLKRQSKRVGQCAVLERGERFVYYLITKEKYNNKPTYATLKQSLEDMRSHCAVNAVSKVSMPRIGCGLDKLEWKKVSEILREVFGHSNISITVYSLPEKTQTTVMKENARQK
ncbi:ADP-ribose glycohydrolase OARD1 [Eucyclogobius newberryi]|uniref:ADP-ribose glycohydrolase OARD1 n=1 Tax=Eucyclogobius newberryi TaxID=166745 RepID=UPI003B5A3CD1